MFGPSYFGNSYFGGSYFGPSPEDGGSPTDPTDPSAVWVTQNVSTTTWTTVS